MKSLPEIIAPLQSALLRAVLTQAPLPGTDGVMFFADMHYILDAEEVILLQENLRLSAIPDLNILILASEEIERRSYEKAPLPYMCFHVPEFCEGRLIVTLEVRLAFGNLEALSLGVVIAELLKQTDGTWKALEMPKVIEH